VHLEHPLARAGAVGGVHADPEVRIVVTAQPVDARRCCVGPKSTSGGAGAAGAAAAAAAAAAREGQEQRQQSARVFGRYLVH
jgi:hypothetical protein